jgi:NADH dehydrogenase FAD-containing subunit
VSLIGHGSRVGAHHKTKTSSQTVKVQTNRQVKVNVSSAVTKIATARLIG